MHFLSILALTASVLAAPGYAPPADGYAPPPSLSLPSYPQPTGGSGAPPPPSGGSGYEAPPSGGYKAPPFGGSGAPPSGGSGYEAPPTDGSGSGYPVGRGSDHYGNPPANGGHGNPPHNGGHGKPPHNGGHGGDKGEYKCPAGLYSNAQCCATDILGVADLNCGSRKLTYSLLDCTTRLTIISAQKTPTSASDFKKICASSGQQAKCCVLPVVSVISTPFFTEMINY